MDHEEQAASTDDGIEGAVGASRAECASCAAPLHGPYCSECGLKVADPVTVRGTLEDLGRHVLSTDSVLWRTLRDLFLDPGDVARRYLAGDRRWLLQPAKLAFLAATLYALCVTVLGIDLRPETARAGEASLEAYRLIVGLIAYLLFLYLLPAAMVLRAIFHPPRLRFAEAYVVLLFWVSQYLLVVAPLLAVWSVLEWPGGFFAARIVGFVLLLRLLADFYSVSRARIAIGGVVLFVAIQVFTVLAGVGAVAAREILLRSG